MASSICATAIATQKHYLSYIGHKEIDSAPQIACNISVLAGWLLVLQQGWEPPESNSPTFHHSIDTAYTRTSPSQILNSFSHHSLSGKMEDGGRSQPGKVPSMRTVSSARKWISMSLGGTKFSLPNGFCEGFGWFGFSLYLHIALGLLGTEMDLFKGLFLR